MTMSVTQWEKWGQGVLATHRLSLAFWSAILMFCSPICVPQGGRVTQGGAGACPNTFPLVPLDPSSEELWAVCHERQQLVSTVVESD